MATREANLRARALRLPTPGPPFPPLLPAAALSRVLSPPLHGTERGRGWLQAERSAVGEGRGQRGRGWGQGCRRREKGGGGSVDESGRPPSAGPAAPAAQAAPPPAAPAASASSSAALRCGGGRAT